ncbi:MAG: PASTA domain-containing protein [Ruminococcaceae bacterium]|nr:PASTA domain-containing protein [Oscillospiraceae bacterium]
MKYKVRASRRKINKKTNILVVVSIVAALILVTRLAYYSIYKYDEYQNKTIAQSVTESSIKANRGTIYDRNMNILAASITVERIFISPADIPQMSVKEYIDTYVENMGGKDADKAAEKARLTAEFDNLSISVGEDIANELSNILGVEKDFIMEKVAKTNRKDETIKKKVEEYIADKVRDLIANKHYSTCIYLEEDSKRTYPYGTLASHVLGFIGTDNIGLAGVELYYNKNLSGVDGKIIKAVNGVGDQMPYKYESYIPATPGTNMMLTIDASVQRILEKNLETCYADTQAEAGVMGIVMDVETFEILGMATLPNFDCNDPYTLDAKSQAELDSFVGTEEDKNERFHELIYGLWENRFITDTYEPGSTFKMIVAASATEEGLIKNGETFYCSGSIRVDGYPKPINCHLHSGHGTQTFEESLWHSCNPVFVTMGLRMGTERFLKYFKAFGYMEKTGIDLPGEKMGLWFDHFNQVELAVSAFGQTFTITPIQHVAAVAAVANGGHLGTPHILKSFLDEDGDVVSTYDGSEKRQVISTETSRKIVGYMENGISSGGSARNAYVKGYRVAAKTGTTVKTALRAQTGETKYISSCVAFAPADDPKVVVMVLVDEPVGSYYGGTIAAPVVSRVLAETLPYLGVEPEYDEDELETVAYTVESYINDTVSNAQAKILKADYKYKVIGSGLTVVKQVPKAGDALAHGGTVVLYTDDTTSGKTVVPNVVGLTASAANKAITDAGLNITIVGTSPDHLDGAIAVTQSIEENTAVDKGTIITVDFRNYSNITD